MTNVVITMAGLGKRFKDAGYTSPKYRIEVHGHTLFTWSMYSLKNFISTAANLYFVVRKEDQAKEFIRREVGAFYSGEVEIVELDHLTDGQATTAYLAGEKIRDKKLPLLVYNIDTLVYPEFLHPKDTRGEGWIPCFPGQGDAWSFAATDAHFRVCEIREKVRISSHATIGLYWFSSFSLYEELYLAYYADGVRMEKGEKYIAPIYNHLIQSGREVFVQPVPLDAVVPLGTPVEVSSFREQPVVPEIYWTPSDTRSCGFGAVR